MDQRTKTYEGMFLLDAGNPDFEAASLPVRNVLTRYGAEILSIKPWDDRKLIYEIRGRKRGLYVLTYFKLDASRVREIEHDCQLDERILRALILRRDSLTEKELHAETPATASAHRAAEAVPGAAPVEGQAQAAAPAPTPAQAAPPVPAAVEAAPPEEIEILEADSPPADEEEKP